MAGLRKLFNVERTLFQSTSPEPTENNSGGPSSYEISPCRDLPSASPDANLPRLPQMQNQTFLGIERQFEDLHDQFRARSSPPAQYQQFNSSPDSKPSPFRNRRHVDVIEATFPSQRARAPTPISPPAMYNEEIADRNIQGKRSDKGGPRYASVISAVYQEDVADRNILLGGGRVHAALAGTEATSQSGLNNGRSVSSLSYYREGRPRLFSKSNGTGRTTPSDTEKAALRVISSDQDLRSHHPPSLRPEATQSSPSRRIGVRQYIALRLRNSAPTLSAGGPETSTPKHVPRPPIEASKHPAYPSPPTTSPPMREARKLPRAEPEPVNSLTPQDIKPKPTSQNKAPTAKIPAVEDGSNQLLSPASARLCARKNVRDLSINTKLAAPNKSFVKVKNQTLDVPVRTPRREPNASIAEIVNSPLPVATPSAISPRTPSYNVDEIMSMFKQAYISSQAASPNPTFETLQDAIVREINSHDAFRQVASDIETMPSPNPSPLPVTSERTEEFRGHMRKKSSIKSLSGKDLQALKFTRKPSFKRKRRNSYTPGKEMSFPAIKGMEAMATEPSPQERKRRHTYTQPVPSCAPDAPELPLPLREEAKKVNLGTSGEVPPVKYSYKLIPDVRPKSSHSLGSKGAPPRPTTSCSLKLSGHSRKDPKSDTRQRSSSRRNTTSQKEPPTLQFDHVNDEGNNSAPTTTTRSRTPSESKSINSVSSQQTTQSVPTKRLNASPVPVGRNRIPLRRSSLHKDLFDSGRFLP
ncbi:hypothetical protein FQN53_002382 [Emmonsiellopsis sp. PD_33]|nr:hypothetical protein FQN53_002382 [Emmonsiellopsis sp. PD_33]